MVGMVCLPVVGRVNLTESNSGLVLWQAALGDGDGDVVNKAVLMMQSVQAV